MDGIPQEALAVEGAEGPQDAFQRCAHWWLMFRSTEFPGLIADDIEPALNDTYAMEIPESSRYISKFGIEVPTTNGDETTHKKLTGLVSKYQFGYV